MWLIEYDEGRFIDGESILAVDMDGAYVSFIAKGVKTGTVVEREYVETFLNNLQAINDNIQSIQSRYYELKGETK